MAHTDLYRNKQIKLIYINTSLTKEVLIPLWKKTPEIVLKTLAQTWQIVK